MINARSGIRLIMRLGMVLIALPEAFTTPIGLALILTARYLSKRIEAALYERLRGSFKHYLAHYRRREGALGKVRDRDKKTDTIQGENHQPPWHSKPEQTTPGNVIDPMRSEPCVIPFQPKKHNGLKEQPLPLNWESQRKPPVNVIHHTMDWKKFSPHYGTITGAKVVLSQSKPEARPARNAKLVRHEIDVKRLSRLYRVEDGGEAGSVSAAHADEAAVRHSLNTEFIHQREDFIESPLTPPKLHAIDMASLERRFGAPTLR